MTFHGDGIKIWAEGVYWGDFPDGGKGMSEFLGGRGGGGGGGGFLGGGGGGGYPPSPTLI